MNISHSWLKEYVEHDLTPEALGEALTLTGLELEGIEHLGTALDGVVVGHVRRVRPHPNADRLTLCDVDLGDGAPVQIACGAPNVAEGQKVPVATVGTTLLLPDRNDPTRRVPVTIKKAKLRGETSNGMICSEDELGLSDDHSGILVLEADAAPGTPFADYLAARSIPAADAVLDLVITPNRPDATSHLGVARDVAAKQDLPLLVPEVALPEPGGEAAEAVTVEIDCPEACRRYVALVVRGVRVGESPAWLKQRLTAVGLRPRNNVVDVTNYVMYECGQPLHAFDLAQIAGAKILVRQAAGGERFTTLDSKEHTLPEGAVMIADAERDVAIGGIMGGENSEVTDATTDVLIESAWFDPSITRQTARALGMMTDASYRFERGVDADGQVWAAARAAQLIAELGGGRVASGMVDAHPAPPEPRTLTLRLARIERILGVAVPEQDTVRILTALGFEVEEEEPLDVIAEQLMEGRTPETVAVEPVLRVRVPTYRPDVEREIDLIEEVARIYGFDRIPAPTHTPLPSQTPRGRPEAALELRLRTLMVGRGYREIYTNSLLRTDEAERFNLAALAGPAHGPVVETLNPISLEMAALRPSLLPGALRVMQFNANHGQEALRFFELGHVFHRTDRGDVPVPGYAEHEALLVALSGPATPRAWDHSPRTADLFDLKGDVEALLERLGVPAVRLEPVYEATPATAHHLAVHAGGVPVGVLARLSDAMADAYDLKAPAFFAELNWSVLARLAAPHLLQTYTPVSRFPVVDRDLAVVVRRDEAVGPMLATIRQAGAPLLREADVFDLYEGEHIEEGRKSIAFALRFGAERTLTDEEVNDAVAAILRRLQAAHGAILRS